MKIILLVSLCFLCSCQFNVTKINQPADKQEAVKYVDGFYSLIKQKKYDDARNMFRKYLLRHNDSIKFRDFLINVGKQVELSKEKKLDHCETKQVYGLDAEKRFAIYYINYFDDGSHVKTSILLNTDNEDYGELKIFAYETSLDTFRKFIK